MERTGRSGSEGNYLDSYRLMSGAVVDLRELSTDVRAFVSDLALRLFQGQGYNELIRRVMDPDSPIYGGHSPALPGAQDRPAVKVAHDLVYRAGIAEGIIKPPVGQAGAIAMPSNFPAGADATIALAAAGRELTTEKIVTVGEAMNITGVTRQAVINAVRAGKLRGEQHGRLWILSREDVLRWHNQRVGRKRARRS